MILRHAGHVGYVVCNMRSNTEAKIGDTLYKKGWDSLLPVAELRRSKPMVFAGVYSMDQSETAALRSAIDKLILNDASVTVAVETRYSFVVVDFLFILEWWKYAYFNDA